MIKQEMVLMLHHDALVAPSENQVVQKKGVTSIHNQAQHLTYLERHPYEEVSPDDMEQARELLQQEMQVVKKGMAHGDIPLPVYTQVWEECLSQVINDSQKGSNESVIISGGSAFSYYVLLFFVGTVSS